MGHEHQLALERIVKLCEKSRQPTKRSERIHDIALCALGLTANQREFEIRKVREAASELNKKRVEKFNETNQVITDAQGFKMLPPGTYTVGGEAAKELARQIAQNISNKE